MKTAYIVQSFTRQGSGKNTKLLADTPIQCNTADEAMNRAERMSDKKTGVIAIAQDHDPDTGEFGKLIILAQYGELPDGVLGYDD